MTHGAELDSDDKFLSKELGRILGEIKVVAMCMSDIQKMNNYK